MLAYCQLLWSHRGPASRLAACIEEHFLHSIPIIRRGKGTQAQLHLCSNAEVKYVTAHDIRAKVK